MQILDGIRIVTTIMAIMLVGAIISTNYNVPTVITGIIITLFGLMSTLTILIIYVDSDNNMRKNKKKRSYKCDIHYPPPPPPKK